MQASRLKFCEAVWPAPANVKAVFTTRKSGASLPPYDEFNLALHVGDKPESVLTNRLMLNDLPGLVQVQWLEQVHGTAAASVKFGNNVFEADASVTTCKGLACAVMTADCLPVLFCDEAGKQVAAAHAGWRGLADGVLLNTVAQFSSPPSEVHACFGPCIGQCHFEVGEEVRDAFLSSGTFGACKSKVPACFSVSDNKGKYMASLQELAFAQLSSLGLKSITKNEECTYCSDHKYYSFRREDKTGRMASLVYIT